MNRSFELLKKTLLNKNLFLQVYVIVCLLYFMPSTLNVPAIPKLICFAWSIVILAYELIFKRSFLKSRYVYLLLGVCVTFAITIALNLDNGLVRSGQNYIYMLTSFFIAYIASLESTKETIKKNLLRFNNIFIIIVMIATVISVIEFLFLVAYKVPMGSGSMARQGFMESRLFGVYTSPNIGAMFGFTSVAMIVINRLVMKKEDIGKLLKITYVTNFVLQVIYFFLASSRGAQVSISAFLLLLLFFFVFSKKTQLNELKMDSSKKTKVIATILIFLFLVNVASKPIKEFMGLIPPAFSEVTGLNVGYNYTNNVEAEVSTDEPVVLEHAKEGAELSAGRFTIWKSAFEAWQQSPVFGFGDTNFYRSGKINHNIEGKHLSDMAKRELRRANGNMHNGYVQAMVMIGGIGFLLIILFYALSFMSIFLSFFNVRYQNDSNAILLDMVIFSLLVSFLVCDFFESHVLLNNRDVIGLVFWYYLGILSVGIHKKAG